MPSNDFIHVRYLNIFIDGIDDMDVSDEVEVDN